MSTRDLGNKLICQNCGAKFYDLKKKTAACPKCETEYAPEKPKTRRAASPAASPKPAAKAKKTPKDAPGTDTETAIEEVADIEVDDSADDSEDDNTLIEDASDIGGDEEDIAGVAVNVDNGEKD